MTHPNPSTALARVVIDQLAAGGARLVVISPGSRSAALAIAAWSHPEIETRVVIDERSAAFHALGAARAGSRPAVVLCTSGTAGANFFPAIVEADMACVPLIAITADRPSELQGVGANQTIDQIEMFGSKVRAFDSIEAPGDDRDLNAEWRSAVARLTGAATGIPPGPVHLNLRFREPTVPVTHDGRTAGVAYPHPTPRIGEIEVSTGGEPDIDLPRLSGERGLVVAGDGDYDREALVELAAGLGWPVLATVLSGMRGGNSISGYHHLLADGIPQRLRPETVVAVGAIGPSTRLESLVSSASHRVRVDRWGRVIDPRRDATHVLRADVNDVLRGVDGEADPDWWEGWVRADQARRGQVDKILTGSTEMTGAGVAWSLDRVEWETMVVASSLPVREVDAHVHRPGDVFANRGASGIDGFVSTALGVAGTRPRTLALAGDLSLLHDGNGFLHDAGIPITFVVIDNRGGGLFDALPQASHAPGYERLFVTDPHRDLSVFAELHGLRYVEASDSEGLIRLASQCLDRPGKHLIRVPVDRGADLAMRAQLDR